MLILPKGMGPLSPHLRQLDSAIVAHTCHDNPQCPVLILLGHRLEEHIRRGPVTVPLWCIRQAHHHGQGLPLHINMIVAGCNEDTPTLDKVAVLCLLHLQGANTVEAIGKFFSKTSGHVLHHKNGLLETGINLAKHLP